MNHKTYFFITGWLFGIIALMHLLRIFNNWIVIVGPWAVPVWFSWIGLMLSWFFCIAAFQLVRK